MSNDTNNYRHDFAVSARITNVNTLIRIQMLAAFFAASCLVAAAPLSYPDQNCTIELPPTWNVVAPTPPKTLVTARSADNQLTVTLTAIRLPASERSSVVRNMVNELKRRATDEKCQIVAEQRLTLAEMPCHYYAVKRTDNAYVAFYCVSAGDYAYMLQAISSAINPSIDRELQSVIASFRLLSPVPFVASGEPETAEVHSIAQRLAGIAKPLLILAFFGTGAYFAIRRLIERRRGTHVSEEKPKRPASVITSTVFLGIFSYMTTAGLLMAIQLKVYDPVQFMLAGLCITAFICLIFRGRAHTTRYVVSAALALVVVKGLLHYLTTPQLHIPPLPPGSPFARIGGFLMTALFGLLFWRFTFGKPSRTFYGLPEK